MNCIFCYQRLLGLRGQEEHLSTVSMSEEDACYKAGVFGRAHALCLLDSGWGPNWFLAHRNYFQRTRRAISLDWTEGFAIINPVGDQVVIASSEGLTWELAISNFQKAIRTHEGVMLPHEQIYNLVLEEHPLLIAEMQSTLRASGQFPLTALLNRLGLMKYQINPEALEGGCIRYQPSKETHWDEASISARIEYRLFIPSNVADHLSWLKTR